MTKKRKDLKNLIRLLNPKPTKVKITKKFYKSSFMSSVSMAPKNINLKILMKKTYNNFTTVLAVISLYKNAEEL